MGVCSSIKKNSTITIKITKQSEKIFTSSTGISCKEEIPINTQLIIQSNSGTPKMKYKLIEKLGKGSYGTVWKVKHKPTGLIRAMKKIPKSNKDEEEVIVNEIELLKKMDHPNIVKIFEFYSNEIEYCLITEHCSGGELYKVIQDKGPLSEPVVANIMYQLFSAINYCQKRYRIIHRDLKPENIMVDSYDNETGFYSVKIIDFGTAKIRQQKKLENKVIGSFYFIAPEVFDRKYNEKCDLWACGIIMYILLSARLPFNGITEKEIIENIQKGYYDLKKEPMNQISKEAKGLIYNLLQVRPENRISTEDALNHNWFCKFETRKHLCDNINKESLEKIIENLRHYSSQNKLGQVVLAFLVHNIHEFLPDVKEINKLYLKLNESNDGKLTKEQMKGVVKSILDIKDDVLTANLYEKIEVLFDKMDNDNNGFIEYEEFCRAAVDKKIFTQKEVLKYAFNFLDKDQSGDICIKELEEIFGIAGSKTEQLLNEIIKEVDPDSNGGISYKKFESMMLRILSQ